MSLELRRARNSDLGLANQPLSLLKLQPVHCLVEVEPLPLPPFARRALADHLHQEELSLHFSDPEPKTQRCPAHPVRPSRRRPLPRLPAGRLARVIPRVRYAPWAAPIHAVHSWPGRPGTGRSAVAANDHPARMGRSDRGIGRMLLVERPGSRLIDTVGQRARRLGQPDRSSPSFSSSANPLSRLTSPPSRRKRSMSARRRKRPYSAPATLWASARSSSFEVCCTALNAAATIAASATGTGYVSTHFAKIEVPTTAPSTVLVQLNHRARRSLFSAARYWPSPVRPALVAYLLARRQIVHSERTDRVAKSRRR